MNWLKICWTTTLREKIKLEVFMENLKRDFITTAEAILLIGTLFMWMYVGREFVTINSFRELFFPASWWFMLPISTFILFLVSFFGRRTNKAQEE